MRREQPTSRKDYIIEALSILERLPTEQGASPCVGDNAGDEPGETLLRGLSSLHGAWRDATEKLKRMERELAVFREVTAETGRRLERKIEELSLLRLITDTTSRAIMSQDPFKPVLDTVIAKVGADKGSIILLSQESGRFELGTAGGEEHSELDNPQFNLTEKVAGLVVSSGKPCLIDDVRGDPRFETASDKDHGIGSLASFPLVAEGETVGVLTVSSRHSNTFGAETTRMMHIIAGQIAVAVQNARLYGEVRKTKEYLENLVERAGDAIFTLDRAHNIVSWNKGAEMIFKRKKQAVVGRAVYDLVPEGSSPMLHEQIDGILDSENIVTVETEVAREDGQTTQIALTLSPIRGAKGEVVGVSGIAKDITERKRVEEELRRLSAAKTSFVSTVSHELRTPLTSIKSYTEILLHDMASLPEDTVRRYLNIMNEECDRLTGLISSVLDLQKLNAGKLEVKLEPLLLADLVRQAAELFDSVALRNRTDLNREFLVPDHMTRIMGDRKRLMQILSNLFSNAFKYTGAGGNVLVMLAREDEGVKLTVTDNGIGIPKTELENVFEKFYRVENSATRTKGGTGLGLAITKELVALHRGRIWVESEEGKGCSFNVLLPATE